MIDCNESVIYLSCNSQAKAHRHRRNGKVTKSQQSCHLCVFCDKSSETDQLLRLRNIELNRIETPTRHPLSKVALAIQHQRQMRSCAPHLIRKRLDRPTGYVHQQPNDLQSDTLIIDRHTTRAPNRIESCKLRIHMDYTHQGVDSQKPSSQCRSNPTATASDALVVNQISRYTSVFSLITNPT